MKIIKPKMPGPRPRSSPSAGRLCVISCWRVFGIGEKIAQAGGFALPGAPPSPPNQGYRGQIPAETRRFQPHFGAFVVFRRLFPSNSSLRNSYDQNQTIDECRTPAPLA
jgi:hypothetical protein